ncbi:MAG TPA: Gldg family protein [Planctomycetota bacterium]|nr:Gldg family protein [Planctomycetota bacterium]
MNKRFLTLGGLGIAVLLLISINVLSNTSLRSTRFDLTQDKLFTLSKGAKNILGNLKEPVTLRLYYSHKLGSDISSIATYAQRVEELLGEMASHSKGKLTLEVIDPEPFSETEDRAVQYGIKGVPVGGAGELLYFGLAGTNTTDEKEIIPFLQPEKESFLEYDVTKLVFTLSNPTKKVLGVMSTLAIEGAMANPFQRGPAAEPWLVIEQLRQMYEVKTLQPNAKEIPADVSVLMVVHPKALGPETLFALDQYVLGGGHAIVFADPYCEADEPPQDPNNPMASMQAQRSSDLGSVFAAWGVQLEQGKIAADLEHSLRVNFNDAGRDEAGQYIVWLNLDETTFNKDVVVTDQIKSMMLATAGVLSSASGATTSLSPLISTGPKASTVPVSSIQFLSNPKTLLNDFMEGDHALTLAAHITGNAKTAFPGGRPKAPEGAEPQPAPEVEKPVLTESKAPISVIVVADCDMLQDKFSFSVQNFFGKRLATPANGNMAFVANAIDYLEGSTDLVSLRSRGSSHRPFEVVETLKKDAEKRFRAQEQELQSKYDQANQRVEELLSKRQGTSQDLLSEDVQKEVDKLRDDQVRTRKELREVRRSLNKDIESLGVRVKMINIALIPALLVVFALGLSRWQRLRRKS